MVSKSLEVGWKVTVHAAERMRDRRLKGSDIEAALVFGREVHTRGVTIYAVGHKEVKKAQAASIDISKFEGIHVLCGRDGGVITIYRNRDLRGLRPRSRNHSYRYLRSRLVA